MYSIHLSHVSGLCFADGSTGLLLVKQCYRTLLRLAKLGGWLGRVVAWFYFSALPLFFANENAPPLGVLVDTSLLHAHQRNHRINIFPQYTLRLIAAPSGGHARYRSF